MFERGRPFSSEQTNRKTKRNSISLYGCSAASPNSVVFSISLSNTHAVNNTFSRQRQRCQRHPRDPDYRGRHHNTK